MEKENSFQTHPFDMHFHNILFEIDN